MSSRASQRAKLTQSDWGLWTTDARQRVITIGGSETFGSVCPKNLSWLRPRDTDCFPPSSRIRSGYKIFVSPGLSPCVGRKKKNDNIKSDVSFCHASTFRAGWADVWKALQTRWRRWNFFNKLRTRWDRLI